MSPASARSASTNRIAARTACSMPLGRQQILGQKLGRARLHQRRRRDRDRSWPVSITTAPARCAPKRMQDVESGVARRARKSSSTQSTLRWRRWRRSAQRRSRRTRFADLRSAPARTSRSPGEPPCRSTASSSTISRRSSSARPRARSLRTALELAVSVIRVLTAARPAPSTC